MLTWEVFVNEKASGDIPVPPIYAYCRVSVNHACVCLPDFKSMHFGPLLHRSKARLTLQENNKLVGSDSCFGVCALCRSHVSCIGFLMFVADVFLPDHGSR